VIAFVGDSTFTTEMPENVTHGIGYIRFIKSKKQSVMPEDEIPGILSKIESGRLTPSFKTNIEHVKHVNDIVNKKNQ